MHNKSHLISVLLSHCFLISDLIHSYGTLRSLRDLFGHVLAIRCYGFHVISLLTSSSLKLAYELCLAPLTAVTVRIWKLMSGCDGWKLASALRFVPKAKIYDA